LSPSASSTGPGSPRPATAGGPSAVRRATTAGHHDTTEALTADPIARRLDELAGDRTTPEIALVNRLVSSFLQRAPEHAGALTDAFNAGDPQAVEDQAHSLRGAAGNIGAVTIMDVCERIENDARARTLTNGTADDLRRLRLELERVERHLHELTPA
jgi:HPt (histidine-containing phosphotransfer) domain-containing protein